MYEVLKRKPSLVDKLHEDIAGHAERAVRQLREQLRGSFLVSSFHHALNNFRNLHTQNPHLQ